MSESIQYIDELADVTASLEAANANHGREQFEERYWPPQEIARLRAGITDKISLHQKSA
ncbi:MAG TPA: hypothetical protein VK737_09615 [Opitutales bacterium]|jgi:hypothetical protein|nr:hypothetical protein [Opitutales bacterium]